MRRTGEFTVRLVRPTVDMAVLEAANSVDIDFILPDSSADLDRLEFVPSDDEMILPVDFAGRRGRRGGPDRVGPASG